MLTFNLKKEWFDKIKSGEKTHEYRELKDYWTKRLLLRSIFGLIYNTIYDGDGHIVEYVVNKYYYKSSLINFVCGYSNKPEHELRAKIKKISILPSGIDTDLKIDKPVYDIEFKLIKEENK